MSIGDNIKRLRTSAGLSQQQFGEIAGVSDKAVSSWENNAKVPRMGAIEKIASYFHISKSIVIDGNDHSTTKSDTIDVTKLKNYVPYNPVKVPFLGEIACGEPIYANQEYDSYVITDEGIHADFCIRAKGDSMINAGIDEGDIVFIRRQSYIDNGSIAAVAIDDTVTLKRFYQSDTTVTLVAENPAYAPIVYDFSDGKSIYILGKAVAVQKPLAPAGKVKPKEEYVTLPVAARSRTELTKSAVPHKLTKQQWDEAQETLSTLPKRDKLPKFDLDE